MEELISVMFSVLESLDNNGEFDRKRAHNPEFPTEKYQSAVIALRDLRDALQG